MHVSRTVKLLVSLLAAALVVGGCSSAKDSGAANSSSGRQNSKQMKLTDQAGRTVTVPEPATRMVVLEHHTLDTIAMLGGQKHVVGVLKDWPSLLGDYMTKVFPGIKKLPTPGTIKTPTSSR